MSILGPKWDAVQAQRLAAVRIRRRVTLHYSRFRSFSRVARERMIERDVLAALVAAGLPVPERVSAAELARRDARMISKDPGWAKLLDPARRVAAFTALAQQGE